MAMRCSACRSAHTEAQFDSYSCLECGARTSFTYDLVQPAKTDAQRGGPDGEHMDAYAGKSADARVT